VEAFNKDHGDVKGPEFDGEITRLRRRFEEILGNSATQVQITLFERIKFTD